MKAVKYIHHVLIDLAGIQFKVLNKPKGPAVHVNFIHSCTYQPRYTDVFQYRVQELKSIVNYTRNTCKSF
jgi:tRNA U34 5-carboxymethylaminomethyl modifying enzyme MnmG/GidA